ncbi:MAG: tripartite tricarboxylate transporter substrate binding protein [Clostridia bacterium]|nr:tripartite tricarboxylate transporter substrate binding protein [Clostridia bacterium]
MKKLVALLLAALMLLGAASALVDYPERAIELIVPANPGGDTDANARALAAALNETMGWNVIVTNMSGGAGAVAFEDALSNPDDGYRFVFYHSGACITQMMGMYEDFNVLDDFKLAGMPVLDYSNAFVINAENEKFSDVESLVAYMKDHPAEVTFATETGSFTHLHVLAFEQAAGVKFNIVDAGTAAQKTTELLGKRLDVIGTQAGLVGDYLKTNQFTCLGILADEELQLGDLQLKTLKEQGYDVVFSKFFYLAAPNAADDAVIAKMNEGLQQAITSETFKAYCANALVNPTYMTPEETEQYYGEQYDIYAQYLADYID